MLLKLNPAVTKLALYDIVHTPGVSWENYNFSIYLNNISSRFVPWQVAADLSHIESVAEVTGFKGQEEIEASLVGAEIVVIPAGESSVTCLYTGE